MTVLDLLGMAEVSERANEPSRGTAHVEQDIMLPLCRQRVRVPYEEHVEISREGPCFAHCCSILPPEGTDDRPSSLITFRHGRPLDASTLHRLSCAAISIMTSGTSPSTEQALAATAPEQGSSTLHSKPAAKNARIVGEMPPPVRGMPQGDENDDEGSDEGGSESESGESDFDAQTVKSEGGLAAKIQQLDEREHEDKKKLAQRGASGEGDGAPGEEVEEDPLEEPVGKPALSFARRRHLVTRSLPSEHR